MNNKLSEELISSLPDELQQKARACKTKEELNTFLAENELELPEDALEMVAGGCSFSSHVYDKHDEVVGAKCLDCGSTLYYWDMVHEGKQYIRMYCGNLYCKSYASVCFRSDVPSHTTFSPAVNKVERF